MAISTLLNLPSAARASYSSGQIVLPNYVGLVLDVDFNVTTIVSGTVTFKIQRVGVDGVLYVVWQPTAISVAGPLSQSIGPGLQTQADFGQILQIDMVNTASITFSASVQARGF